MYTLEHLHFLSWNGDRPIQLFEIEKPGDKLKLFEAKKKWQNRKIHLKQQKVMPQQYSYSEQ